MDEQGNLIDQIAISVFSECQATGRKFIAKVLAHHTGTSPQSAHRLINRLRSKGLLPPKKIRLKKAPDPILVLRKATRRKCRQRLGELATFAAERDQGRG